MGNASSFDPRKDVVRGMLLEVFTVKTGWRLGYVNDIGLNAKGKFRVLVHCAAQFLVKLNGVASYAVYEKQLTTRSTHLPGTKTQPIPSAFRRPRGYIVENAQKLAEDDRKCVTNVPILAMLQSPAQFKPQMTCDLVAAILASPMWTIDDLEAAGAPLQATTEFFVQAVAGDIPHFRPSNLRRAAVMCLGLLASQAPHLAKTALTRPAAKFLLNAGLRDGSAANQECWKFATRMCCQQIADHLACGFSIADLDIAIDNLLVLNTEAICYVIEVLATGDNPALLEAAARRWVPKLILAACTHDFKVKKAIATHLQAALVSAATAIMDEVLENHLPLFREIFQPVWWSSMSKAFITMKHPGMNSMPSAQCSLRYTVTRCLMAYLTDSHLPGDAWFRHLIAMFLPARVRLVLKGTPDWPAIRREVLVWQQAGAVCRGYHRVFLPSRDDLRAQVLAACATAVRQDVNLKFEPKTTKWSTVMPPSSRFDGGELRAVVTILHSLVTRSDKEYASTALSTLDANHIRRCLTGPAFGVGGSPRITEQDFVDKVRTVCDFIKTCDNLSTLHATCSEGDGVSDTPPESVQLQPQVSESLFVGPSTATAPKEALHELGVLCGSIYKHAKSKLKQLPAYPATVLPSETAEVGAVEKASRVEEMCQSRLFLTSEDCSAALKRVLVVVTFPGVLSMLSTRARRSLLSAVLHLVHRCPTTAVQLTEQAAMRAFTAVLRSPSRVVAVRTLALRIIAAAEQCTAMSAARFGALQVAVDLFVQSTTAPDHAADDGVESDPEDEDGALGMASSSGAGAGAGAGEPETKGDDDDDVGAHQVQDTNAMRHLQPLRECICQDLLPAVVAHPTNVAVLLRASAQSEGALARALVAVVSGATQDSAQVRESAARTAEVLLSVSPPQLLLPRGYAEVAPARLVTGAWHTAQRGLAALLNQAMWRQLLQPLPGRTEVLLEVALHGICMCYVWRSRMPEMFAEVAATPNHSRQTAILYLDRLCGSDNQLVQLYASQLRDITRAGMTDSEADDGKGVVAMQPQQELLHPTTPPVESDDDDDDGSSEGEPVGIYGGHSDADDDDVDEDCKIGSPDSGDEDESKG